MEVLQGPSAAAQSLHEEGVAMMRELGDQWGLACSLCFLGASVAAHGDDATARSLQQESAAIFRELGDMALLAVPLSYLGYMAIRRGDCALARSLLEESLRLWSTQVGTRWGIAWRLEGFAGLAAKEGQPERAARLFGAAKAMLDAFSAHLDPIDRLGYDKNVTSIREQLGDAAFGKAWAEGRAMTMEQAIAYALEVAHD